MSTVNRATYYVSREGRASMNECLAIAVARCVELPCRKLVVFTGSGEGAVYVLQEISRTGVADIDVIAVTPPVGRPYRLDPRQKDSPIVQAGIPREVREFLENAGVAVVSAHLPFKAIGGREGPRAEMTEMGETLSILGGGFALCVQAALVACDAGEVAVGERVVVATADTAILVAATRTESFLSKRSGLVVDEIFCRPAIFDISKAENAHAVPVASAPNGPEGHPADAKAPETVERTPISPPSIDK